MQGPMAPSGGRLRLQLAPDQDAPAAARRALRGLPLGDRRDDVLLMASELVSNAVRHAGLAPDQPIELDVDCGSRRARVDVHDRGRGFGAADVGRGYGLRLVDAAADRWGFDRHVDTHVWFEVMTAPMGRGGFEPPSVGL